MTPLHFNRRPGSGAATSLGDSFARTCERRPDEVALVDGDARLTFADWDRLARRTATSLETLGVSAGDVVAYQLPNWWEAAVLFLAAARMGAVANPVLPIFRERELRFILRQSGARALLVPGIFRGRDYRSLARELRDDLPGLAEILVARGEAPQGMRAFAEICDGPAASAASSAPGVPEIEPDALLLLMYTSGTTAEPKGVLHSHATLIAEVESLARVHSLGPGDVTLMPSPLTHISGVIHAILAPAVLGTRAVLMDRWEARLALDLIERERVTYMVGAPTFLADLADHAHGAEPADAGRRGVSSLRLFSCGGADVSADLIQRARARLGCVAKRVYGSTEFPTITTTDAADADTMGADSEGRPILPSEVRVVDERGGILPPGGEGEVQARGPECFVGYADPTLDAEAFTADGWFRTGDLGRLDAEGYLRITGRLKEIVVRKGEKFSIRELEELIASHPAIEDVAVVAMPDAETGERACAAVVLRAGTVLTLAELTQFLTAAGLARQKLPEQLEVFESLPRTESGKVQRAAIKGLIANCKFQISNSTR